MQVKCNLCDFVASGERRLTSHYNQCHRTMVCHLCNHTATSYTSYRVHMHRKHPTSSKTVIQYESSTQSTSNSLPDPFHGCLDDLTLLTNTRENPMFPDSNVNNSLDRLIKLYLKYAGGKCVNDKTVRQMIVDVGESLFDFKKEIVDIFSSRNKVLTHLEKNYSFVPAKVITIGNSKISYISLEKNLTSLLQVPGVVDEIESSSHLFQTSNNVVGSPPLLSDFFHGYHFSNIAKDIRNDRFIMLLLYTDEFGITNPLGSKSSSQKTFAMYFTIANIRKELRSQLQMYGHIFLCKSAAIKAEGLGACLKPFLDEWHLLQNNGIIVNNDRFDVHFLYFPEDNLAAHLIGGFSKSFTAFRPSRFCMSTRQRMQEVLDADECTMRSVALYETQLERVLQDESFSKTYGVSEPSPFSGKIVNFHPIHSLPPDIMHDLLEGVFPKVLALILKTWVTNGHLLLRDFNERMKTFPFFGTDKSEVPAPILNVNKPIKATASQMACLLRFFFFFVRENVSVHDEHYKLWVLLRRMQLFMFAPRICRRHIQDIKRVCEMHLTKFVELYPDVSVTPKLHNTLHYAYLTDKYGPLSLLSCMRFEAVHERSKRFAAIVRNFKNASLTLAMKQQLNACFERNNPNFIFHKIVVHYSRVACNYIPPSVNDFITSHGLNSSGIRHGFSVSLNTVKYSRNDLLCLDVLRNGDYQFGILLSCYQLNNETVILYYEKVVSQWDENCQCFVLERARNFGSVRIQELYDMGRLHVYHQNNTFVAIPKYFICVSHCFLHVL
jgi:hypothetical protein